MRELLLIQVRPPGDAMAEHERSCVRRRFGPREVRLRSRNVLEGEVRTEWLEGVDGIVIGGSGRYSVHHPESATWVNPLRGLLDRALAERLPGFGICFGHQLLAMHLGASVRTDESRMESGTVEVQGVQEDPVFARVGSRFHVHTGHTDLVESVPDGCRLLASTGRVPVQALRMDTAPWWTAQFHPDLTHDEAAERYRAFARALESEGGQARPGPSYEARGDQASTLLGAWFDEVFTEPKP